MTTTGRRRLARMVVVVVVAAMTMCRVAVCADAPPPAAAPESFLSKEHHLFHRLFTGGDGGDDYHRMFRPVVSGPIDVAFRLPRIIVEGLDEKAQVLTCSAVLEMRWKDDRLKWEGMAEFDGLTNIRVPVSYLWTPDIILYNSVAPKYEYSHVTSAVLFANGTLLWRPLMLLKSRCTINLDRFPYDVHTCPLVFGSAAYDTSMLRLSGQKDGGDATSLQNGDGVWPARHLGDILEFLLSDVAASSSHHLSVYDDHFDTLTIDMTLKRRTEYLTTVFVVPALALLVLSSVVFALPPESSEKMTLGVGLLLGEILLLGMLETVIPSAHPTAPNIAKFYVGSIVLICMSLGLAALVRTIWYKSANQDSPPIFMAAVRALGRPLCVTVKTYRPLDTSASSVSRHRLEIITDDTTTTTTTDDGGDGDGGDDYWQQREQQQRRARQNSTTDWRCLALVLDRLFLVGHVMLVLLVAVSLLS